MDHEYYMREALASARKAASEGETPVGAVIVKDGEIIGPLWPQPGKLPVSAAPSCFLTALWMIYQMPEPYL